MILLLLLLPGILSSQKNEWILIEKASINVPGNRYGCGKTKTGFGFEGGLLYSFADHWQAAIEAGWHEFTASGSQNDQTFAYLSSGSLQSGIRYNRLLNGKTSTYLGISASRAVAELSDQWGRVYQKGKPVYGYTAEGGLNRSVMEGLQIGVFVKYYDYLPEFSGKTILATDHAGAGVSLRWTW